MLEIAEQYRLKCDVVIAELPRSVVTGGGVARVDLTEQEHDRIALKGEELQMLAENFTERAKQDAEESKAALLLLYATLNTKLHLKLAMRDVLEHDTGE